MKVYYSGNFWGHTKGEHAGKEQSIQKEFQWGKLKGRIPSIYVCAAGIVIDFCFHITKEEMETFMKRWNITEEYRQFSEEEQELINRENPCNINFSSVLQINGKEQIAHESCGVCWIPNFEHGKAEQELASYYGCDMNEYWYFTRVKFPWLTKYKTPIKSLGITLIAEKVKYTITDFVTRPNMEPFDVTFTHPATNKEYQINVLSCENEEMPVRHIMDETYQLPRYCHNMMYEIIPELSMEEIRITDCKKSDAPVKLSQNCDGNPSSVTIIGGADGPTAIFVAGKTKVHKKIACSGLHYEPQLETKWKVDCFVKEQEDITISVI